MTDAATGGAIGGLTGGLFRTMGPRISSALGRTFNAGCFVAGTQVHISHLPNDIGLESQVWADAGWLDRHVDLNVSSLGELASYREHTSSAETFVTNPQSARCGLILEANRTTPRSLPIEEVPLGARVPTKNPRPWEFDDSLPEPDQATWVKLSLTMHRADGGVVDAELLRPGWWIEANEIQPGKPLPMNLAELEVFGSALVTAIEPCPAIADGEGSVVTARFVTREVHELVRLEILGPEGEVETVTGTPIHPIWSEDRQDWVPLGELLGGETLRTSTGLAQVHSLTLLNHLVPVYNIEVHGQHVYQVGLLGLLVHNAGHHCNPVAFGNDIPYGHKLLTDLSDADHAKVHAAINAFLKAKHGRTLYAGEQWWTSNVRWQDRYKTMIDFYRDFDAANDTNLFARFMAEIRGGIRSGFNPLGR